MNVSGAVGGIVSGVVVAGASFAVLGAAAAVVTAPYVLAAGLLAVRAQRPLRRAEPGSAGLMPGRTSRRRGAPPGRPEPGTACGR